MPSKLNELAKGEYTGVFGEVESGIFVDFTGVGSEETYALRKALREQSIRLRVVKTSLARVALKELGRPYNDDQMGGAVAIAWGEDPVAVAKGLVEHRRAFPQSSLKLKGGFLEGAAIDAREVTDLSNLPDRQQLLGLVAGAFAAPLTAFIGVQAEIIRKLLYAFEALKDKREKAGAE